MTIPQYIGPVDIVPLIPYIALAIVIGFILAIVPGLIWIERVVIALMQDRLGPNRVGPRGLLQTIADGVKLFFKEDIEPGNVDKRIYYLAPVLSMIPALAAGATLPFAAISVRMADGSYQRLPLIVGDVNIGILFILALASLQVYGIVLAGWSSNNKYSLLGGLRSAAQIISYELAMSLSIMTGILMSGSLNLTNIVNSQAGGFWNWNLFNVKFLVLPGFLAGIIYMVSMIAETNRAPFDLPEAESELIAGFHTEYSSMKFAMFFMGEYASMLVVSGIATALWLGGWNAPFDFWNMPYHGFGLGYIPSAIWFLAKLTLFILVYVWLRASLPRLRYDALMNIGWKRLLPASLVILFLVAAIDAFRAPEMGVGARTTADQATALANAATYHVPASASDHFYREMPPPPAPSGGGSSAGRQPMSRETPETGTPQPSAAGNGPTRDGTQPSGAPPSGAQPSDSQPGTGAPADAGDTSGAAGSRPGQTQGQEADR